MSYKAVPVLPRLSRSHLCSSIRHIQKRCISVNHIEQKARAQKQWDERAKEIRAGKRKSVLEVLEERGLVRDIAGDRDVLQRVVTEKRVGAYVGIDPTASSLHVGHLLPLMVSFWLYIHGCRTTALIGGATAKVGDPSGRTIDRTPMTSTERKNNIVQIHYQLTGLGPRVDRLAKRYGYIEDEHWRRDVDNNNTWWNTLPFLDVLQYLGNGLRMGSLLSRDTVKTKLNSANGMSFSEFCYPLLQAWDWWNLYNTKGIQIQIGGQDQYGNIVSGIDAIKYMVKTNPKHEERVENGPTVVNAPYGMTVPLLTTASGEKFGKSAGNAIWLDERKTSIFDLYGFFVRTADADVERYLKLFTFMPMNEVQSIMDKQKVDPSKRVAQHRLAFEFVYLVHGQKAAETAAEQHRKLYQKPSLSSLTAGPESISNPENSSSDSSTNDKNTQLPVGPGATQAILPVGLIMNTSMSKVFWSAGLVTSRSEGHRLLANKGAYIGGRAKDQMSDDVRYIVAQPEDPSKTWEHVIQNTDPGEASRTDHNEKGLLILRAGKSKVRAIRVVSDEKFMSLGLPDPPGWTDYKGRHLVKKDQKNVQSEAEKIDDDGYILTTEKLVRKDARLYRSEQKRASDQLLRSQHDPDVSDLEQVK